MAEHSDLVESRACRFPPLASMAPWSVVFRRWSVQVRKGECCIGSHGEDREETNRIPQKGACQAERRIRWSTAFDLLWPYRPTSVAPMVGRLLGPRVPVGDRGRLSGPVQGTEAIAVLHEETDGRR